MQKRCCEASAYLPCRSGQDWPVNSSSSKGGGKRSEGVGSSNEGSDSSPDCYAFVCPRTQKDAPSSSGCVYQGKVQLCACKEEAVLQRCSSIPAHALPSADFGAIQGRSIAPTFLPLSSAACAASDFHRRYLLLLSRAM
ncbi:hypothetical protein SRHO_G00175390 [Serrasalmus rhombeus]